MDNLAESFRQQGIYADTHYSGLLKRVVDVLPSHGVQASKAEKRGWTISRHNSAIEQWSRRPQGTTLKMKKYSLLLILN